MSNFYSFSTIPRAFDFLTTHPKTPTQLTGNLVNREISSPKVVSRPVSDYGDLTPVKKSPPTMTPTAKDYNKAVFGGSSRRTIEPTLNVTNNGSITHYSFVLASAFFSIVS